MTRFRYGAVSISPQKRGQVHLNMTTRSKTKDNPDLDIGRSETARQPTPVSSDKAEYPLRSKRRLQTRAALLKSAFKLMSERGFDNVTMQEVADGAGTHAQTLYAHFPNKYSLGAAAAVESLRVALAKRETDTLTFWRKWVEERTQETYNFEAAFSGLVYDTLNKPRFALVNLAVSHEYIDVLTENLAQDFQLDAKTDLFPKLVAQMLMGASEHAVFAWWEDKSGYDLLAGALKGVDEVIDIVELVSKARGIAGTP